MFSSENLEYTIVSTGRLWHNHVSPLPQRKHGILEDPEDGEEEELLVDDTGDDAADVGHEPPSSCDPPSAVVLPMAACHKPSQKSRPDLCFWNVGGYLL